MRIVAFVFLNIISALLIPSTAADYWLYNNGALQNGFQDWSWATNRDLHNTTRSHSGSSDGASISWVPNDYEAIYFHSDNGPAFANYAALEFWFYATSDATDFLVAINEETGGPSVKLSKLVSQSQSQRNRLVNNDEEENVGAVPTNKWVQVVMSFADFPVSPSGSNLIQLWFQAQGGTLPVVFIDDVSLTANPPTPTPTPIPPPNWDEGSIVGSVQVSLDASSSSLGEAKPISPLIYGASFASSKGLQNARYTVSRNGGNAASRFNWEKSIHNTASDWFFYNIAETVTNEGALPEGNSVDVFLDTIKASHPATKSIVTFNMIGFVPTDDRNSKNYSYSIKKYGEQTNNECKQAGNPSWCNADAGNGISQATQQKILGPDIWKTTSKMVDELYNIAWLDHLSNRGTLPDFASLDNEPMLWSSTHFDVWPEGLTYGGLWNRTLATSNAIKKYYPNIKTLGPVVWGWCAYFYSAADGCTCGPDCKDHDSIPLLEWYVKQNCKDSVGDSLVVDYLDIHFYPQASGINSEVETAGSDDLKHRFNSPKSLYKSGYTDESWINQQIYLIPRMHDIITKYCPKVKFSISEYSFGSDDLISVALVTAEALAIYGREGVDMAVKWVAPDPGAKTETSFKFFTNFDGSGSNLVDGAASVPANTSNVDFVTSFGIYSKSKNTLYVLLFNKEPGNGRINVQAQIEGLPSSVVSAQRFSFGKATANIVPRDNVPITNGKFSLVMSIFEATILAIKLA